MDDHDEELLIDTEQILETPASILESPLSESIPEGFDAITIYLEGGVKADLNWSSARKIAVEAIAKGMKIFWALDLRLFQLTQPLSNQGQFLSLALSIEHFRDTFSKEFREHTLGVSLFRGNADFSEGFAWDFLQENNLAEWLGGISADKQLKRLFCRDVAVEYLLLLANRLPDTLPVYLFLENTLEGPLWEEMQYFNPERFERFRLAIKNSRLPYEAMGWGKATPMGFCGDIPQQLPEKKEVQIGICVPQMSYKQESHYMGFKEALQLQLPYKLIAENHLTSQWDGLDYLIFSPTGLSVEGKRKLQGFCAAGGTAVSIGDLIGLPQELTLQNFPQILK